MDPPWRRTMAIACYVASAYGLAWVLVVGLLRRAGEPGPGLILGAGYLLPLLVGLLLNRLPLPPAGGRRRLLRSLLLEAMTVNVGFAVLFAGTLLSQELLFSTLLSPANPYFGLLISCLTLLGALLLLPLAGWQMRYGGLPGVQSAGAGVPPLPDLRHAAWPLAGSLLILLLVMAGAIAMFA